MKLCPKRVLASAVGMWVNLPGRRIFKFRSVPTGRRCFGAGVPRVAPAPSLCSGSGFTLGYSRVLPLGDKATLYLKAEPFNGEVLDRGSGVKWVGRKSFVLENRENGETCNSFVSGGKLGPIDVTCLFS